MYKLCTKIREGNWGYILTSCIHETCPNTASNLETPCGLQGQKRTKNWVKRACVGGCVHVCACVRARACVCVCVREREIVCARENMDTLGIERDRDRATGGDRQIV